MHAVASFREPWLATDAGRRGAPPRPTHEEAPGATRRRAAVLLPVVRQNPVHAEIVDGSGRARQPRSPMLRLVAVVIRSFASLVRSRRELLLENLALRQQLTTMVQKGRPRIRTADRIFWVALRRVWSRWAEVLVVVKPETVVGWHRAGYRLYWQRLSRRGRSAAHPRWRAKCGSHPPDGHGEPLARAKDSR